MLQWCPAGRSLALLTTQSTRPKAAMVLSMARTLASFTGPPPAPAVARYRRRMPDADWSGVREVAAAASPRASNWRASERPIPRAAPVINQTLQGRFVVALMKTPVVEKWCITEWRPHATVGHNHRAENVTGPVDARKAATSAISSGWAARPTGALRPCSARYACPSGWIVFVMFVTASPEPTACTNTVSDSLQRSVRVNCASAPLRLHRRRYREKTDNRRKNQY